MTLVHVGIALLTRTFSRARHGLRMLSRVVATVGVAVIAAVWLSPIVVAQESLPRTVLAIHGGAEDFPGSSVLDRAIREVLQSRADAPVNYHAEYLESELFPTEPATVALRDYIRRKFDGRRIDVVVADTMPALQFAIRFRAELFPGVPIVFVAGRIPEAVTQHTAAGITGVLSDSALGETLDLALSLHPLVKRVFVVAHAPTIEGYDSGIRATLGRFSERVELTYVRESSLPGLLAAVRAISPPALILYARYTQADTNAVVYPDEVARLVAGASSAPVYGIHDLYVDSGIVGGMIRGSLATGTRVGQIARQILDGTPPENIPIEPVPLVPTFDWRQLQRWGIDTSRLPAGSDVRFRQPSTWEAYRWYIVTAVTMVALQMLAIGGLLAQRARRRLAERETLLLRQEIAHSGRVSMMGQLASGLAHEINQPLASILRNAEAAELFLQHPSPDLDEIRAILSDIRSDDERAGQVIDRMRGLLKRQTLDTARLDVGALVGDVVALLRIDAATRQVKLAVDVPADLPHIRGDRVQIQQVLLNLILNGMDALHETKREDRRVDVAARLDGSRLIEIAVGDTGPGIPADTLARIFDPFFTTKPNGMGIGLAVSRTIVEAHSGRLWAENRNSGGAVFRFTLPIAEEGAAV